MEFSTPSPRCELDAVPGEAAVASKDHTRRMTAEKRVSSSSSSLRLRIYASVMKGKVRLSGRSVSMPAIGIRQDTAAMATAGSSKVRIEFLDARSALSHRNE